MIEALNLIPARTFPCGFFVRLFLVLCIDIGGLLSRNRPTNYNLEFNSHAMGFG
jgi:hypothetical protein